MIKLFDLETTHLKGNMGFILVAVAKELDADHCITWRIDDTEGYGETPKSYTDDSDIVRELIDYLSDADAIVAHYGDRFDRPYLNTRALYHGMSPLPPVNMIDPWKWARKNLALTSNRMGTIADLLGSENQKYQLPWSAWRQAHFGDKKAMDMLTDYCVNDVETLEDVYKGMRPLISHHPYVGATPDDLGDDQELYQCPACSSVKTQRRGIRRTKKMVIRRVHCQNCGTWFDGKRKTIKDFEVV